MLFRSSTGQPGQLGQPIKTTGLQPSIKLPAQPGQPIKPLAGQAGQPYIKPLAAQPSIKLPAPQGSIKPEPIRGPKYLRPKPNAKRGPGKRS